METEVSENYDKEISMESIISLLNKSLLIYEHPKS